MQQPYSYTPYYPQQPAYGPQAYQYGPYAQQQQPQGYPLMYPSMVQQNPVPFPMAPQGQSERPRHVSRRTTAPTQQSRKAPLRSAMKPGASRAGSASSTGGAPLARARTTSGPAGSTRSRVDSNAWIPDHLFVSLNASHELRIDNVAIQLQRTLDEIKESVLPMWPHGYTFDFAKRQRRWHATFNKSPWNATGTEDLYAKRMICRLFAVLSRQGFTYLTTAEAGHPFAPPRLVFMKSDPPESTAHFVAIWFSESGRKVHIIDPPSSMGEAISLSLRVAFPKKIAFDQMTKESVHVIELKRGMISTELVVERDLFMARVLQQMMSLGYQLDASVPFARRGPLGLGGRKEVWIFKRASSRQS